jgi:hypothetical protein
MVQVNVHMPSGGLTSDESSHFTGELPVLNEGGS